MGLGRLLLQLWKPRLAGPAGRAPDSLPVLHQLAADAELPASKL